MKRVLTLLLVAVLAVALLAACDTTPEEIHVHTYDYTALTGDGTGHWYDATCECTDAPIIKLDHVDDNNDGACDICKFIDHKHTYSEDWTADCTNHWNAASCGHVVAGTNVTPHSDANSDGKCDVCAYVIEDIHTHLYSTEYTYDEQVHWYAPICEHADAEVKKDAHNVDATGVCTVCGAKVSEVDKSDFLAMLTAAMASNHKVTNGTVVADEFVYGAGGVLEIGKTDKIYYILGDEQSYIFYKSFSPDGEFLGAEHQWFERISDEEVFAVNMYIDSHELTRIMGDTQFLYGYTYMPGILLSAADDTTSLAVTVYELYALTSSENAKEVTVNYDAVKGVYSFSYTYVMVNVTNGTDDDGNESINYAVEVFDVNVSFTIDDNFVIDYARIFVDSYRNLEGVDNDLIYDPATGEYTFTEEKSATSYHYIVNQMSGERTYINPYSKKALTPVEFELYTDEGVLVEESVTLPNNSSVNLYLGNLFPITAYATFIDPEDFEFSYVNNDDRDDGVLWSDYGAYFSTYDGCISFYAKDAGSYTMTVKYGDFVKVFEIELVKPNAGGGSLDSNQIAAETTDTYAWEDTVTFVAKNGSGTYTFTLPAGLGYRSVTSYNKNTDPEHDISNPGVNSTAPYTFSVELEENEVFTFHISATKKASWVITYTFTASESAAKSSVPAEKAALPLGSRDED